MNSLEDLVSAIHDGASVAVAPDYSGCAMAAVRALIRRGARDLDLLAVPQAGFQADMLIGAGCVGGVEAAAITLGEYGFAPRFTDAVKNGRITLRDSTCPAIHAGLQATEKGVPFMPLRGILGSDLLTHRDDWKIVENPFSPGDAIVALPAIRPDVALFHAATADRHGNVWIGVRRELMIMAHAAHRTLITVEEIVDDDLLADETRAAGTIPAFYVSAIAEVRNGAWPIGLAGSYPADAAHLAEYARLARTAAGFQRYLDEHVGGRASAA
jgi:glutaconate CoA-transferase subunit A